MRYLSFLLLWNVAFAQVTKFTPVDEKDLGLTSGIGSPTWVDFNQDGLLDLYGGSVTYINNGNAYFTLLPSASWRPGCVADYNNDGYPDILTHKRVGDTTFISIGRNSGTPNFEIIDVTEEVGLLIPITEPYLMDPAWLDFDNDGWLDFFYSNYESRLGVGHPDYLFRSKGDGTFEDVSGSSGVSRPRLCSRGVSCADFDNDGDMDIFVSVYRLQRNLLWRNNGDGTFTDVAGAKGVRGLYIRDYYGHNIGACWGDFNNDGYLDLFSPITHHPGFPGDSTSHLWVNNGPPDYDFTCIFATTGMANSEIGSSPSWVDYDNDGDLDLYWVNLYGIPGAQGWLYRNNGDGTFTDVTVEAGLKLKQRVSYALWGDINHDGFMDVYLARDTLSFLINNGNQNNWLELDLKGVESNRSAIGARINVYAGSLLVVREIAPNNGHGYGHPFVMKQHFGLGGAEKIDSIKIRWPSGIVEDATNISSNLRMLRTEQGPWLRYGNASIVGDSVIVRAFVFADSGIQRVVAEFEHPDENIVDSLLLYDDGAHHDGLPGDSIYGNIRMVPSLGKTYFVDIKGVDNTSRVSTIYNVSSVTSLGPVSFEYYEVVGSDTVLSPGDSVQLRICAKNESFSDSVLGIEGKFTTNNPHISFLNNVLEFGDMESEGILYSDNLTFCISDRAPPGTVFTNVFFTDSLYPRANWIDSFYISIIDDAGPFIHLPQALPTYLQGGDEVILRVKFVEGSGVDFVEAYVTSRDLTVSDSFQLYDDGLHHDSLPFDSVFGNIWTTQSDEHFYDVRIYARDSIGNETNYPNLLEFTTKPFTKTTNILLVDDDNYNRPPLGAPKFYETYYEDALNAIGKEYDIWNVFCYGSPDTSVLNQYEIIIWQTGSTCGKVNWAIDWYNSSSLSEDEQYNIKNYLLGGGKLFLSSQGIVDFWDGPLRNFLRIQSIEFDVGMDTVIGIDGNPISEGVNFAITGGSGASNQFVQSAIQPFPLANSVFSYKNYGGERCAAIMHRNPLWDVVTFGFGFESINSEEVRDTVMKRAIDWLLVGVEEGSQKPVTYFLAQNYPNPFLGNTVIKYGLPKRSKVRLSIYNVAGQKVVSLVDEVQNPGYKKVTWNGKDSSSSKVGMGVYFYLLEADNFSKTRKLIHLK